MPAKGLVSVKTRLLDNYMGGAKTIRGENGEERVNLSLIDENDTGLTIAEHLKDMNCSQECPTKKP